MAKKAGKIGVGPKIVSVKTNKQTRISNVQPYKDQFVMILYMDKLDGTLKQFLKDHTGDSDLILTAIQDIEHVRRMMREHNICHNDLHENNVMFKEKIDENGNI